MRKNISKNSSPVLNSDKNLDNLADPWQESISILPQFNSSVETTTQTEQPLRLLADPFQPFKILLRDELKLKTSPTTKLTSQLEKALTLLYWLERGTFA